MKSIVILLLTTNLMSCSKSDNGPTNTLTVRLESPANNGTLKVGQAAQFSWASSATDGAVPVYHAIKITEILLDQSPEVALRTNKPFFEKDSIGERFISITPVAGTPGLMLDKKYAWQVNGKQKTLSSSSSISTFTVVR